MNTHQYWGETSESVFERANSHIEDAEGAESHSHMHVHMTRFHPGIAGNFKDIFKFQVVEKFKSAFNRQLEEPINMKNCPGISMNLREEYSRCMIPDVILSDRGWQETGPQRESANIDPKDSKRVIPFMKNDDEKIERRMIRNKEIEFKLKKRKNRDKSNHPFKTNICNSAII